MSSLCVRFRVPLTGMDSNACAFAGKAGGLLVLLGFGVATFAPAAYQRPRLGRPCETSSCGRLRA